jgi:glyoxylate reductase
VPGIFSAHKEWASVSEIADTIEPKARSREEFIEECKSGAFDKVVAAYRTFQSVAISGLFDEELVSILPKSLKFIAHNGRDVLPGVCGRSLGIAC